MNDNFNFGSSNHGNILNDIKQIKFRQDFKREFKDLKDFYLTDEQKANLKHATGPKKHLSQFWYLIKNAYFHLTPFRRFFVLLGTILLLIGKTVSVEDNIKFTANDSFFGGVLILFVLILELKDKLIAKSELEEGQKVQRALMPPINPEIEGWDVMLFTRSANDVSGDLVDFLQIDDDRIAITIADVAGKGLSAALLTAKLQATIRAYAEESTKISELAKRTNHVFHRDSLPNLFASMIYMELSSSNNQIKYVNAGHFPPIVINKNGISELPKGEAALGLMENSNYSDVKIELEKDDLFVAYSDGVTESINEYNLFYGKERFLNFLKSNHQLKVIEIGNKLLDEIDLFRGEAKANDDLSFVILKRK
ncbi:MAG: serine/threonine-protein phosphatase [Ignavibacteriaceae bacterium]|nr:serine/threonine-protein phosphatase [Ignavibacteriaceae bacterium]